MKMNHTLTPLYDALVQFINRSPVSFHVPGHKSGTIFPEKARDLFESVLSLDMTELPGLDDLHAPHGVIAEAQDMAADFFGSHVTHFLVGGSTAGNLAMILASCSPGDKIIVQRNSHKSIFNGLELSGARPIVVAPEFDEMVARYTAPSVDTFKEAFRKHPDAKALIVTYPDYFGKTYALDEIITQAHEYDIPVLVDEAHGVHFSLDSNFPTSALAMGADAVVQSAHKMAPALTMGAYLHIGSGRISRSRISHYLQMVQSSSPSYPIMASLDLARSFMARLKPEDLEMIMRSVSQVRDILDTSDLWDILPADDPLKITIQAKQGLTGNDIARPFEQQGIYPELTTSHQLLLIHGLSPFNAMNHLKKVVRDNGASLNYNQNHAIIEKEHFIIEHIKELDLDYSSMQQHNIRTIPIDQSAGYTAAEPITPYPPGIPFILKGERITRTHITVVKQLISQGVTIQHRDLNNGISVFI